MKPQITKDSEGRYWCTIADEKYPDGDDTTVEEWFAYMSCGCGASPVEAYRDWLEDCRDSLMRFNDEIKWL